jgi:membrane protein YqaA with SNARE-associated domain
MKDWLNKLHAWCLKWVNTKWGEWALFFCAFSDASIFGLPTPMVFFALAILNLTKAYRYALIGTLGILSGSVAGYSIGHFAWINAEGNFTGFAQFIFKNIPGFSEGAYNNMHNIFEKWDYIVLFIASFLPVPFMVFSISSGVFDINLFAFCLAIFISQGIRFYLMAFLIIKLGPEVRKLLDFKFTSIAIIATACIVAAIVIINII